MHRKVVEGASVLSMGPGRVAWALHNDQFRAMRSSWSTFLTCTVKMGHGANKTLPKVDL